MLRIKFNKTDEMIFSPSKHFDYGYRREWFDDPLVKEMIKDVDKSTVFSYNHIESEILGPITYRQLSGGVKALILMLKTDDEIYATACGDNCAKWIMRIAQNKDVNIVLTYDMKFPREQEWWDNTVVINAETGDRFDSYLEYFDAVLDI